MTPRAPSLALLVAVGALTAGCKARDRSGPSLAPSRPGALPRPSASGASSSEAPFVIERPAEPEPDPVGPAGDLRAEVDAFRDVPSCVRSHRVTDPLLTESLDALGYDSFVTDACRSVEALATRDPAPCAALLSSALRRRCEEQLAMFSGQPALCPTTERTLGVPERAPLCLAAARRDLRPCAALHGLERATCEGLLAHDAARCGLDARCLRTIHRWMSVLPVAPYHAPHAGRISVEVRSEVRDRTQSFELEPEAAAGAVVAPRPGGVRLLIGDPRTFFVVDERAGGGLVLDLPSWPQGPARLQLTPSREARMTLRLVDHGALELTRDSHVLVSFEEAPPEAGRPLKLRVEATLGPATSPRYTVWNIDTWLREAPSDAVAPVLSATPARP